MSVVWLLSSLSNLFSAYVARRVGLVRAMVLLHLPCALFLALIPLASKTWYLMIILLLGDAVFGSMDQAPREAFVAAMFLPRERTQAMGTLNFVRTIASSLGPLLTAYVWTKERWWIPFELAAVLKVCYDIGMLVMFLKTPLPEERRRVEAENGSGEPQEMAMTAADLDVNILMDEYSTGDLAPPSDFEISDGEEEDDERTLTEDDQDISGRRRKYSS
jgi:MFS family permease